jgi:hypothetical protein
MLACDRISEGWQVWLTPRQTRIIFDALSRHDPKAGETEHCEKLVEWFGAEVKTKAEARRKMTGER